MSTLEVAANVFNLISIVMARRNSVHTWWSGIVGCVLFGILFFQVQLYADVSLQIFFVVTSLLGIWNWQHGGDEKAELPISRMNWKHFVSLVALALVCTGAYGAALYRWTDASFPFVDSIVLTLSILAQFLLMGRKLENWLVWIVVNSVAIPLYASKELYLTATLYTFFLGNAVYGWYTWKRLLKAQM